MNKKLTCIVVDDEPKARKNIIQLIKAYIPEVKVSGEAGTISEAVNQIDKHDPDIVFLDIEMNNESGFDLFDRLNSITFRTIFITAHDEYAVKAFKYSAFDYILKPIDIDELENTIKKLIDSEPVSSSELNKQHKALDQNRREPGKIVIPGSDSMAVVDESEIIRCESAGNYCVIHLDDGRELVSSKTIKHFEEILDYKSFCRIHRAHLINIGELKEYRKGEGGEVELKNGKIIPVSRRKKKSLLNRLLG